MQVGSINSNFNKISYTNKNTNNPAFKNKPDTVSFSGLQEKKLIEKIIDRLKNTFTAENIKKAFYNFLDVIGDICDFLSIFD